jgi:cytochrome c-type biogenesis protein CcmH
VILFWLICAGLVIIALAFILPPLLQQSDAVQSNDIERREANIAIYRDQLSELQTDLQNGIVSQEQYDQDRNEIERRLLEDVKVDEPAGKPTIATNKRGVVYLLALGLPLIAVLFYLRVGELKGLSPSEARPVMADENSGAGRSQQQIDANVAALVERLKTNPNDSQGWVMLARSYNSMGRFGESAGAYARATELLPNEADLWAEYAFVSAMANGRQLEGQPMELVNKALELDPENLKALQLAGNGAFQRKDYKKAVEYWTRVLKKVPEGSEVAQSIQERLNEAKSLAKSN